MFVAERGFDWQSLLLAGASLSLFASKRILEVRLPTGKPGPKGAEALMAYAAAPAPDTLLLIISDERPEAGSSWINALETRRRVPAGVAGRACRGARLGAAEARRAAASIPRRTQ